MKINKYLIVYLPNIFKNNYLLYTYNFLFHNTIIM